MKQIVPFFCPVQRTGICTSLYLYLLIKQIVLLVVRHRNCPRIWHKLPAMPSISNMIRIYFKITAGFFLQGDTLILHNPPVAQWPWRRPTTQETSVRSLVPTPFCHAGLPPPRANRPAHNWLGVGLFTILFFLLFISLFLFLFFLI